MANNNQLLESLSQLGVDINDGLQRFSGNADLYMMLLRKFPKAAADADVFGAMECGDVDAAVKYAHTLKGVTGNLSLTPLFNAYTVTVDSLRAGCIAKAQHALEGIADIQRKIIACIEA